MGRIVMSLLLIIVIHTFALAQSKSGPTVTVFDKIFRYYGANAQSCFA